MLRRPPRVTRTGRSTAPGKLTVFVLRIFPTSWWGFHASRVSRRLCFHSWTRDLPHILGVMRVCSWFSRPVPPDNLYLVGFPLGTRVLRNVWLLTPHSCTREFLDGHIQPTLQDGPTRFLRRCLMPLCTIGHVSDSLSDRRSSNGYLSHLGHLLWPSETPSRHAGCVMTKRLR